MEKYTYTIKDWPEQDRPRERLIKFGADKLQDAELLAILLRTGGGENTAFDLARKMLNHFGGFRGIDSRSVTELYEFDWIGPAKAAQIKSAIEIGKRMVAEKVKINSAASIIFIHNHPSGDPSPSGEDKLITTRLVKTCELVGIKPYDHIIIGNDKYFSFAEQGLM